MAFWNKPKEQTTHTNAPRHWPAVRFDQFEVPQLNLLAVGAQLAALHAPPRSTLAFMRDFVYEDGILQAPIVVEEAGVRTCVFVYSNRDTDAAAHYSGVRALLKSRENANAVYYGPAPLAPAAPARVLQQIDTPMFSRAKPAPENADFALWWATPEDPLFSQSPDRALLDRWFEALDGFGYVLFSAFVHDLELSDEKEGIFALPGQPLLEPLTGPADANVLLHASAREGLFLAFERSRTSARERHRLLKLLADFSAQFRVAIDTKKIPPRAEEKGLDTWKSIRDDALSREAGGDTDLTLHAIVIRDGQSSRSPAASGAGERAAQPAVPGREQLDFAMDLVDRVVARMAQRPVAHSSQETLGQPNVFPIIAAREDGHTWERYLPYEDGTAAHDAAERALDDWPHAELVAVLVDGAVREDGVRTDVLRVKLEDQHGVAADLIQRYATSETGALELVGNPTVTPIPSFLRRAAQAAEPAADPRLAGFAAQAVDEILTTLAVGDSGDRTPVDGPYEPLTSPSALRGRLDSRPTLARFLLQGPVTAAASCAASLEQDPADWVVFYIDDVVTKDDRPDRRLRICVQRRADEGSAVFDQRYELAGRGKPPALRGELEFRRWGTSFFRRGGQQAR